MPDNKPTGSKPTKRRPPADQFIWELLVDACGGRCLNPTCKAPTGVQLVRGHIQRRADGGFDDMRNLMPLCRPCNSQFNQEYSMGDLRPVGWQSRFLKLLCGYFGVVPTSYTRPPQNTDLLHEVNGYNPTKNKQVLPWDLLEFEAGSELYTDPSTATSVAVEMDLAKAAVDELVRKGMNLRSRPIAHPKQKVYDAMCRKVANLRPKYFLLAGHEFLDREHWFDEKGFILDRTPWETFLGGVENYLKESIERRNRKAKQDAEERERATKAAAAERQRVREERWTKYLNAALLNWPTMTDADREFLAGIQGDRENVQDVSEVDWSRIKDIETRRWAYGKTTRKYALQMAIERVGTHMLREGLKFLPQTVDKIVELRKAVDAADWEDPMLARLENELQLALRLDAWRDSESKAQPEPQPEEFEDSKE